jgi:hypothetical protein
MCCYTESESDSVPFVEANMMFNPETTIGAEVTLLPVRTKSASAADGAVEGSNEC